MNEMVSDMIAVGFSPPDLIPGKLIRFPRSGHRTGSRSCYAVLFEDMRGGVFGDWATGEKHHWQDAGDQMTAKENRKARQAIDTAKRRYTTELKMKRASAETWAISRWFHSSECSEHQYLIDKGISGCGARLEGKNLIIPVYINRKITSIQSISPTGEKRFQAGGAIKGGYFCIGKLQATLIICEGFATGASLFLHTRQAVAVAFNSGNLFHVAKAIKERHPNIEITIAADNDAGRDINAGLDAGRKAAQAIGARLIYPDFSELGNPDGCSDFNDYLSLGGEI